MSGEHRIFEKETLGYDALVASAAVPPIFRAVNIDGVPYWDGVFTTNPPVQIHSQACYRREGFADVGQSDRESKNHSARTSPLFSKRSIHAL